MGLALRVLMSSPVISPTLSPRWKETENAFTLALTKGIATTGQRGGQYHTCIDLSDISGHYLRIDSRALDL